VLRHGTGAINVDGCRVGTEKMGGYVCEQSEKQMFSPSHQRAQGYRPEWDRENKPFVAKEAIGRWPANLILSYPEDEYELRDDVTPEQLRQLAGWLDANR